MTDFSPAAEAVIDAYHESLSRFMPHANRGTGRPLMAAVLRAAADQVIEEVSPVEKLLAIAAELDGTNYTSENVLGGDSDG